MHNLFAAFRAEWIKARRSRVVLITFLAFSLLPLIAGFFMILLKNPDAAAKSGLMAQKAKLLSGEADWPSFFSIICQGIAVGGLIVFGFLTSWIFGREHADKTIKDILALPTPRYAVVTAKYILLFFVCFAMSAGLFAEAIGIGGLLGLPGGSAALMKASAATFFAGGSLTIILNFPVAFFAHWGKGYLSPLGFVFFSMVLAQVAGVAGWGAWFPWSVPSLLTGMSGTGTYALNAWSIPLVLITGMIGVLITLWRWQRAEP